MGLSQDAIDNASKLLAKFHRLWQPHGYMPSKAAVAAIEAKHGMTVAEASTMIDKASKHPGAKVTRSWGQTKVQLPTQPAGEAESALSKMVRMTGSAARKLSPAALPSEAIDIGRKMISDAEARGWKPREKTQAIRRKAIGL